MTNAEDILFQFYFSYNTMKRIRHVMSTGTHPEKINNLHTSQHT